MSKWPGVPTAIGGEAAIFGIGGDAWYKWKGTSTLDWTWHNWDLNATLHMLDGFWEELFAKKFDGKFEAALRASDLVHGRPALL